MATLEERMSALESTYGHLATKADLAELEARIEARFGDMEARLMRWFAGTIIASVSATAAVAVAISRLIG